MTLVDPDAPVSVPRLRIVARTEHERPELVILRDDSSPAAPPVPGGGASSARTVAAQTDHIARWTLLKELDNPAWSVHGLVDVRILAAEPDGFGRWRPAGPIAPNPAGEIELAYRHTPDGWEAPQVHIEIHNGHDRRLWCTLLNLTDRYRSHTALFPGDFIAAHHTAAVAEGQPIPVELPEDRPVVPGAVVRDWCKIIVAPHEINTTPYELPPLASPSRAGQQPRLRDMGTPSTPKVQGEWATLLVPIVTVVPG